MRNVKCKVRSRLHFTFRIYRLGLNSSVPLSDSTLNFLLHFPLYRSDKKKVIPVPITASQRNIHKISDLSVPLCAFLKILVLLAS
jgi:hypothetical protein